MTGHNPLPGPEHYMNLAPFWKIPGLLQLEGNHTVPPPKVTPRCFVKMLWSVMHAYRQSMLIWLTVVEFV